MPRPVVRPHEMVDEPIGGEMSIVVCKYCGLCSVDETTTCEKRKP